MRFALLLLSLLPVCAVAQESYCRLTVTGLTNEQWHALRRVLDEKRDYSKIKVWSGSYDSVTGTAVYNASGSQCRTEIDRLNNTEVDNLLKRKGTTRNIVRGDVRK